MNRTNLTPYGISSSILEFSIKINIYHRIFLFSEAFLFSLYLSITIIFILFLILYNNLIILLYLKMHIKTKNKN